MWTPQWVDRAIAEPTVLVIPMQSAPRALAYSSAYTPAISETGGIQLGWENVNRTSQETLQCERNCKATGHEE